MSTVSTRFSNASCMQTRACDRLPIVPYIERENTHYWRALPAFPTSYLSLHTPRLHLSLPTSRVQLSAPNFPRPSRTSHSYPPPYNWHPSRSFPLPTRTPHSYSPETHPQTYNVLQSRDEDGNGREAINLCASRWSFCFCVSTRYDNAWDGLKSYFI